MMNTKLFKKIAGVLGYKLIDKNHDKYLYVLKILRLIYKIYSIIFPNRKFINSLSHLNKLENDGSSFDEL